MDWPLLISNLLSSQSPVLPTAVLARIYLALGWGLVLCAASLWVMVALRIRPQWRLAVSALVLLWSLWPGVASPTYWLGLAFRAPSLSSVLLCAWWLGHQFWPMGWPQRGGKASMSIIMAGIALGWLLLLDTFAVWPYALYAWGFSPAALGVVAGLVSLRWLLAGQASMREAVLPMGLLAAYVLLRLPTGNLWDALLDPWLWLGLHVRALWLLGRRRRQVST